MDADALVTVKSTMRFVEPETPEKSRVSCSFAVLAADPAGGVNACDVSFSNPGANNAVAPRTISQNSRIPQLKRSANPTKLAKPNLPIGGFVDLSELSQQQIL
jgi:hypothetical protein